MSKRENSMSYENGYENGVAVTQINLRSEFDFLQSSLAAEREKSENAGEIIASLATEAVELQSQLSIAVEALKEIQDYHSTKDRVWANDMKVIAGEALAKIEKIRVE